MGQESVRDEPDSNGATRLRLVLAAAISPWSIVPVLAIWILIGGFDGVISVLKGDEYFFESFFRYLSYLVQWSLIGIGPAYVATIFYGIPVYLALKGLEVVNLLAFLAAGVLGGVLLALFFDVGLGFTSILVACGAVVAGTFRTIASN